MLPIARGRGERPIRGFGALRPAAAAFWASAEPAAKVSRRDWVAPIGASAAPHARAHCRGGAAHRPI
jgi:hypothetical protein